MRVEGRGHRAQWVYRLVMDKSGISAEDGVGWGVEGGGGEQARQLDRTQRELIEEARLRMLQAPLARPPTAHPPAHPPTRLSHPPTLPPPTRRCRMLQAPLLHPPACLPTRRRLLSRRRGGTAPATLVQAARAVLAAAARGLGRNSRLAQDACVCAVDQLHGGAVMCVYLCVRL